MNLAHPLQQQGELPLALPAAAVLGILLIIALAVPGRRLAQDLRDAGEQGLGGHVPPLYSWEGRLGAGQKTGRGLAIALLAAAVVAGRIGSTSELENLAPALVIGTAWPVIVALSVALGPVWRWLDPFDGLARIFARSDARERVAVARSRSASSRDALEEPSPDAGVLAAIPAALAWSWYLCANSNALHPRAVGAALALYTVITVAGCLTLGRVAWMASAEVFNLFFGWVAHVRKFRLLGWRPPRGAALVLGVLAGGLLFGGLRQLEMWGTLAVSSNAALYATTGVFTSCALGAGMVWMLETWASARGSHGLVVAATVPAVASIAVALALVHNRLLTSIQLLPDLLGDPFGWGWNLFGITGGGLDPDPLGTIGRWLVQATILLVGHALGARLVAHRAAPRARLPAIVALTLLFAAAVSTILPI
ncbi:MAG: hypothetical protein ACRDJT_08815 [Actinomycetota bacterium]